MLKINSTGLVNRFLERYRIWCDYKTLYHSFHTPVIQISKDGIPCFHYTDVEGINSSTSKTIAIDCLTEGINRGDTFRQYATDKHYIIFSNGQWQKKLNIKYDLVPHLFFLFEMADTYLSPNRFCFYLNKQYQFDYPKPSIFSSTIGNVRPERDYVVTALKNNIEYDNFIARYSGENIGLDADRYDIINFSPGDFDPYTNIFEKYYHNVSQSLPINMYNQSYFNLVVETDIDYVDNFFLTEKTVKVLITGMPFVVVSTPYFLKNLQQLGFTTYNQLWDESYDSITDYRARVDTIVNLCNNLKNFDWAANKNRLKEIQLQNQTNFLNLTRVASQEFENFENIIKNL